MVDRAGHDDNPGTWKLRPKRVCHLSPSIPGMRYREKPDQAKLHRLLNGFETILRLATDLAHRARRQKLGHCAAHPLVVIGDQDSHKVPEL